MQAWKAIKEKAKHGHKENSLGVDPHERHPDNSHRAAVQAFLLSPMNIGLFISTFLILAVCLGFCCGRRQRSKRKAAEIVEEANKPAAFNE